MPQEKLNKLLSIVDRVDPIRVRPKTIIKVNYDEKGRIINYETKKSKGN